MAARVVTNSSSNIPHEIANGLGIAVVPLFLLFGEVPCRNMVHSGNELRGRSKNWR